MDNNIVLLSIGKGELQDLIKEAVREELISANRTKTEKELLNAKEVCEFLGIHISTLNSWKSQGKIPYKKIGKRIFFKRDEVLGALKDNSFHHKLKQLK